MADREQYACPVARLPHTATTIDTAMLHGADCHVIIDFLQKELKQDPQRAEHELAGNVR